MRITDEGIVLNCRRFQEKDLIATVLLKDNGKFKGFLRSKKKYDSGTFVTVEWHARLEDQLGTFTLEEIKTPKTVKDALTPLLILSFAELADKIVVERDPVPLLYQTAKTMLENPTLEAYAKLEQILLKKAGYGLHRYPENPSESLRLTAKELLKEPLKMLPTHRILLQKHIEK